MVAGQFHGEAAFAIIFILKPPAHPCLPIQESGLEAPVFIRIGPVALFVKQESHGRGVFVFPFPCKNRQIACRKLSCDGGLDHRLTGTSRNRQDGGKKDRRIYTLTHG